MDQHHNVRGAAAAALLGASVVLVLMSLASWSAVHAPRLDFQKTTATSEDLRLTNQTGLVIKGDSGLDLERIKWIQDKWEAPHGVYYSAKTISNFLEHRHLLVVGDSLGRQFAATLNGVAHGLGIPSNSDKGLDKGMHGQIEHIAGALRFDWAPTLSDLVTLFSSQDKLTGAGTIGGYTDIIICVGAHDASHHHLDGYTNHATMDEAMGMVHAVAVANSIQVWWRSAPSSQIADVNEALDKFNDEAENHCHANSINYIPFADTFAKGVRAFHLHFFTRP